MRKIRSYVRREGRMTPAQQRALEELWPIYGLQHQDGKLDLEQAFGREAPTTFEIGFGMGDSLFDMAKAEPERNFIGVEVHRPGVGSLLGRVAEAQLSNIRIYQHDAVEVLHDCIPDHCLERVQIFFPDPWHKKRHHKRRLIQSEFLNLLAQKLESGAVLHLATDWVPYAEHMLAVLQANAHYLECSAERLNEISSLRPETKFERRGQKLGHDVVDLCFKCKSA